MKYKQLQQIYDNLIESIKQNLSAKLMGYDENNPLEVKIVLELEAQGLSDCLKATIYKIYQDKNIIYVYLNDYWAELDLLFIEEKLQIIKYLEEND